MLLENASIQRSKKRRTLAIQIGENGDIKVYAPFSLKEYEIQQFIDEKKNWINKAVKSQKNRYQKSPPLSLNSELPYLGKTYQVAIKPDIIEPHIQDPFCFIPTPNAEDEIKSTLINWLKARAKEIIPDRVDHFAQLTNLHPNTTRVKEMRGRWGSCSSLKNVNFSWKLIFTPLHIIDYVVIHELCHLQEMNHSKRFWDLVERHCKTYRSDRNWLKEHQAYLSI